MSSFALQDKRVVERGFLKHDNPQSRCSSSTSLIIFFVRHVYVPHVMHA